MKALPLILGLIAAGATESGLGYGLLPFVVGIYEMQAGRLTPEMAQLFETYYLEAFGKPVETAAAPVSAMNYLDSLNSSAPVGGSGVIPNDIDLEQS